MAPRWPTRRQGGRGGRRRGAAHPAHGGQETTLLALYITLMHFGGIIVPPGYTDQLKFVDGNPYGASLLANRDNISEFDESTQNTLDQLARRVVSLTDRLTSLTHSKIQGDQELVGGRCTGVRRLGCGVRV